MEQDRVEGSTKKNPEINQDNIFEKGPLHNSPAKPDSDGNPSSSPKPISPDVTNPTPQWSLTSASPQAEPGPQSSSPEPSPQMKSPPIQTMGQPTGYDPNRIPASIFSTKPGNPAEWSVASNESLFSIHMGNNSFSRDYAILFGKSGDFSRPEEWNSKSGELPRLEEWNNPQSNLRYEAKSNDLNSLPPVMEVPTHEESSVKSGELSRSHKANDTIKVKEVSPENQEMENSVVKKCPPAETTSAPPAPPTLSSSSRLSNVSGNSCSSFAFPVLVNDGGKGGSLKAVPEKPEQPEEQARVSKETPEAPQQAARWCSCFPWWPQCC